MELIAPLPQLDQTRCDGCGVCVAVCPEQVLALVDGRPHFTRPAGCAYCGVCEEECPTGAITLAYEIVLGEAS